MHGDFAGGKAFFHGTQTFRNGNGAAQIALGRFGGRFRFVECGGDGRRWFFYRRLGNFVRTVGNGNGRFNQRAQLGKGNRLLQVVERTRIKGFDSLVGITEGRLRDRKSVV